MGVMVFSAMAKEHKGHLFSGHWSDEPKRVKTKYQPLSSRYVTAGKPRVGKLGAHWSFARTAPLGVCRE